MEAVFPFVVRVLGHAVTRVHNHPKPEIGVLLLDPERWWQEDIVALSTRAQLFAFPSAWRQRLLSCFLTADDIRQLRTMRLTGAAGMRYEAFVAYLARLLPALADHLGFHVVTTTNHMYVQNAPIAEACSRTRIPFVDCYKECMKDDETVALFLAKCRRQQLRLPFLGNRICVYNAIMRDAFLALGVAPPERIAVTGALRIDRLLARIRAGEAVSVPRDTVTLFSFRHVPVGADPREYVQQFSPDRSRGYARLFDEVHAAFGQLAAAHPHVQFVVKLKWHEVWGDYVRRAITRGGYDAHALSNLRIVALEEDAQDLITRSIAVIGLNSTTLLEARLAGRPVIIPYFAEIRDRYPETLLFRSMTSEFIYADSVDDLRERVMAAIANPPPFRVPTPALVERYFGYDDGRALDRVLGVFRDAIREQAGSGISFHAVQRTVSAGVR